MVQLKYAAINTSYDTYLPPEKTPSWSCTDWSSCSTGQQTRTCTDSNGCYVETDKPTTTQSCCNENWSCGAWSACITGEQSRSCSDLNSCGTTNSRPALSQACTCAESWQCTDWSTCANGKKTRTCTDAHNCGTNINKPEIETACTSTVCTESWSCGEWSTCINYLQTRTCIDLNSCGITLLAPATTKVCLASTDSTSSWAERERKLVSRVDKKLVAKIKGRILLQVEERGEAWYVDPLSEQKHYLGRPVNAFNIMRKLGLGISEKNYASFKGKAPIKLAGRILLRVESAGGGLLC